MTMENPAGGGGDEVDLPKMFEAPYDGAVDELQNSFKKYQRHKRQVYYGRLIARIVRHVDPDAKIKAARTRLEKDLPKWLKHHGGEAFPWPWSEDHQRMLKKISLAVTHGGLFAVAMPRGHGKTTILKWVIAYILLTGKRKYVIALAATAELARDIVDFIFQQLTENENLHEQYPHVTTYFRAINGKALTARYQLRGDGKSSGIKWSKNVLVFPDIIDKNGKAYQSNGGIIEVHGLSGAVRGKNKNTKTGKVMRPDFVLLDDPQDRESAESATQCSKRERIITGDVLGLAGPNRSIAAVMSCTIICKGDLADRFLDHKLHPEWQGETCRLVKKWPRAQDTLWTEYTKIHREESAEGRGGFKAAEFYKSNRAAMDEGSEVAWEHRVRAGEISALQTAENLLIETGSQFWAEYQNEPRDVIGSQYELTTKLIMDHEVYIPRLHIPESNYIFVGHCDINRSGLHWCTAGFDQSMTGHCPAYGRWPQHGELWKKNACEMDRKQAIFKGLKELCDALAATTFLRGTEKITMGLMLIDLGYESDVVHRFCNNVFYPFKTLPAGGRAAHKYFVKRDRLIGRPYEGCHIQKSENGPYLIFNSDLWRETSQRAFLTDTGAPGGFTLYKGTSEKYHIEFAEQVVAERLKNKYETDAGLRWEWAHQPGSEWDWGDAVTGCWVAAAASGLSASGQPKIAAASNKRRPGGISVINL